MGDEYASEIMRLAVARACVALGFKNCEKNAIDSLADVLQNYIRTLGEGFQSHAESAGRVHAGIQDVLPALEFTRPKNTNWTELSKFAFEDVKRPNLLSASKWCQPFPFEVPDFPIPQSSDAAASGDTTIATSSDDYDDLGQPFSVICDAYIPEHLPPYPPVHTYKRTTSKIASSSRNGRNSTKRARTRDTQETDDAEVLTRKVQRSAHIKSAQQSLSIIEDSVDARSM
mmetsp:Transcript_980/g.1637  ORF Transcript_980/g.1637 Transcript_980/m.1637 type:complete len:229 (-) Transcript_980:1263-1949(-)